MVCIRGIVCLLALSVALCAAIPTIPLLPDKLLRTLPPLATTKTINIPFDDRVRQAALEVYVEGMTQEIADQLGADAVPVLKKLLADTSFPRHDNVVAFLTYLANDDDTAAILDSLASSPQAADRTPEDDRAFLLAPHALGYMAKRGSDRALKSLLRLSAARPSFDQDPALVDQVLFGLARSGKPEAMVRLGELAKQGLGVELGRKALLALNEGAPGSVPIDIVAKAQLLDVSTASAVQAAGSVEASVAATAYVTYCNHPEVTSKMTDATLDAVLAAGSALVQTANPAYPGDVACSVGFARLGSAGVFGTSGDGLASIDTNAELTTTLNSGCGWIKVVRLINYCGGTGTNIIGCGWIGSTGVAVVRYTALGNNGEGTLWVHEMGHNAGLSHLTIVGNIMYPSVNSIGGLTSTQCTAYTNLASAHTCFPASARVRVQGKGLVPIGDLVQDDQVADAAAADNNNNNNNSDNNNNITSTISTSSSPFIAFLHAESKYFATFVAIKHEHGVLKATPDHYIFKIDPVTLERTAIRAQDFKAGDHVLAELDETTTTTTTTTTTIKMAPSKVLATSLVQEQGIFAPLTESGSLIVDGVLSSCYADVTSVSSHDASHLTMLPLRWLYKTFPSLADKSPSAELHWYATLLMKMIKAPGISSLL